MQSKEQDKVCNNDDGKVLSIIRQADTNFGFTPGDHMWWNS